MKITEMDLNLLRVFEALIGEKHVSSAAAKLSLSQPAVSNALARLRRLTGDELFVRTRDGMQPTAYSIAIADRIGAGMALIREALEDERAFDPSVSDREFTLLIDDVTLLRILPNLIPAVRAAAPAVRLKTRQAPAEDYRQMLESGAADAALGPRIKLEEGYYQQEVWRARPAAVMRADHPLLAKGDGKSITLEDYLSADHVAVVPPGTRDRLLEQALAALGHRRRIVLEIESHIVVAGLLRTTDLVVTMSADTLDLAGRPPGVAVAPLPFHTEEVQFRLLWHGRVHRDPAHQWLRQMIMAAAKVSNRQDHPGRAKQG